MQELNSWTTVKAFIDAYNIMTILDFENKIVSELDIATQNQLAKNSHLYNRAVGYIQSRRTDFVQKTYF